MAYGRAVLGRVVATSDVSVTCDKRVKGLEPSTFTLATTRKPRENKGKTTNSASTVHASVNPPDIDALKARIRELLEASDQREQGVLVELVRLLEQESGR